MIAPFSCPRCQQIFWHLTPVPGTKYYQWVCSNCDHPLEIELDHSNMQHLKIIIQQDIEATGRLPEEPK